MAKKPLLVDDQQFIRQKANEYNFTQKRLMSMASSGIFFGCPYLSAETQQKMAEFIQLAKDLKQLVSKDYFTWKERYLDQIETIEVQDPKPRKRKAGQDDNGEAEKG